MRSWPSSTGIQPTRGGSTTTSERCASGGTRCGRKLLACAWRWCSRRTTLEAKTPPDADASTRTVASARLALSENDRHRVEAVASLSELSEALRSSGAPLPYTEVPQDRRATALGMTPVNYPDFHMGFEGACRSLERLVHLARVPFFRRYQRHLAAPEWRA